jgi:Uma2 family endonuclease
MVESGILSENDGVELVRGEIIEMSLIGLRYAACVKRLNRLFYRKLGDRVLIGVQDPVELNDTSEPQPDVVLLQPREDFYESSPPQSSNIFLLVEVADKTVQEERELKIPLYAEDNIAEVWLVDINGQCVEVYREPTSDRYQNVRKFEQGTTLSILAFPDVTITVDEVLGE